MNDIQTPRTNAQTYETDLGYEVIPAALGREMEKEIALLKDHGGLMRKWIGDNEKIITKRWDACVSNTALSGPRGGEGAPNQPQPATRPDGSLQ